MEFYTSYSFDVKTMNATNKIQIQYLYSHPNATLYFDQVKDILVSNNMQKVLSMTYVVPTDPIN